MLNMRKFVIDSVLTVGIAFACFYSFCLFYLELAIDKIKNIFK